MTHGQDMQRADITTKCYNIVQMARGKSSCIPVAQKCIPNAAVGCATFRNTCGHFEHAGLARNVNRKYSVSPDFNYEARMVIARKLGQGKGVRQ
ncbi:hypothetical protein PUN28_004857 [Cardiocondyla obscurior]|uniref:Uncharacterized protein n=1 Tax=Cardiocondyla obscurior TaxID=286306 RepID=A0AAW2GHK0_9HYME